MNILEYIHYIICSIGAIANSTLILLIITRTPKKLRFDPRVGEPFLIMSQIVFNAHSVNVSTWNVHTYHFSRSLSSVCHRGLISMIAAHPFQSSPYQSLSHHCCDWSMSIHSVHRYMSPYLWCNAPWPFPLRNHTRIVLLLSVNAIIFIIQVSFQSVHNHSWISTSNLFCYDCLPCLSSHSRYLRTHLFSIHRCHNDIQIAFGTGSRLKPAEILNILHVGRPLYEFSDAELLMG